MPRFVATYNERGIAKLRGAGATVMPRGRHMSFWEDDITLARTFFRRYVRNFFGVRLSDAEFSIYEEPPQPRSELGWLSDPDTNQESKPGLAGAPHDGSQPRPAP